MKRVMTILLIGLYLSGAGFLTSCGTKRKNVIGNNTIIENPKAAEEQAETYSQIFSNHSETALTITTMLVNLQYAVLKSQNVVLDQSQTVGFYEFCSSYEDITFINPQDEGYSDEQSNILIGLITDYESFYEGC